MFAIETTSRVKFIFMKEEASKILLIANFSLRYTCHRTKIFKYPVFLLFGRNFFEQRNANENIISHFWLNLKKSFLQARCFFKKQKFHVVFFFWQSNMARHLAFFEELIATDLMLPRKRCVYAFRTKNLLEICRQEQFYGATWINGNPYYHTKLLSTSNLKLYPKVIVTSVRMVKSMSFRSNFFKCLL